MLGSVSNQPVHILGLTATRDESKPELLSRHEIEPLNSLGSSTRPFSIRPYPDSPYTTPATFKPIRVLLRSQLPLTFLDTATGNRLPPNGLFAAHIDVLKHQERDAQQDTGVPRVLIAQYEASRTFYAIERISTRMYSMCMLATWIKEKDIKQLWSPTNLGAYAAQMAFDASKSGGGPWWQSAVVETKLVERPIKRMSMMRQTLETVPVKAELQEDVICTAELDGVLAPASPQEPTMDVPTAQEQLESLVQQYLDAVYTSKTSLAYFAKGPITRIRNKFTSPTENAPPTCELVAFLRSMLLSPKASEKKYYEKLPAAIRAMPIGVGSDEEVVTRPSKSKLTKKKTKLNRDGVYPVEDLFIKKWWRSEMPSAESAGQETMDIRIRRRIGDLRVRETLAQMILMLEIVALESLAAYKAPSGDGSFVGESQTQNESQDPPKKRRKKLDDIALQLDLLLDKLSIWHATEEAGILDFDANSTKAHGNADGPEKGGASDRLHGFCVEVIVPFYMSRLPEQALAINKKLGGPATIASSKRKAMRPPLTSKKSRGSKEPEAKKSRRSLARVATDTTGRTGSKFTPSLARSVTDTALLRQSIKRETSEAPLSTIPFQRSPSRARQSMSQLRHLQGREMDLTTTSAAAAAKLKHKARVEDDLKEAIATLKNPNRDLAAGSYMADLEKRGLGSTNRLRKPANPVRRVVKDVQVTATPRAGRKRKMVIDQTPVHYHHDPFTRPAATEAAPMSEFCIPSSGVRQPSSVVPGTIQRSATARELAHSGVAETPSKVPTTKTFTSGAARRTIFATPVKVSTRLFADDAHQTSNIFETPVKAVRSPSPVAKDTIPPTIAATPIRPTVSNVDTPPITFATPAKKTEEASIYDALGWNDDDDFA